MTEDKSSLIAELEVGVTYASLMSAVSLFFTGILISQYHSFDTTIKVPIIYLIISTFSFIFAATIYSNAGSELTLNRIKSVEKHMIYSKNIVELLGLYLFVLATPLVIGAVTKDSFLRTTTIIVAIVGFVLYSQSKFSVLEKELTRTEKRLLSLSITILALLLYFTQSAGIYSTLFMYVTVAVLLLAILLAFTAIFCLRSKQYIPIKIREFEVSDAEKLSKIINANIAKVKNAPFPVTVLDSLREKSSTEEIKSLASRHKVFVAEFNNLVVGMGCLDGNKLSSVFSDPGLHRKGVGTALVSYAEADVSRSGYHEIDVTANLLNLAFYKKLDFKQVKDIESKDGNHKFEMHKNLYDFMAQQVSNS